MALGPEQIWLVKPTAVHARRASADGVIETGARGKGESYSHVPFNECYRMGDWVVTTPNGLNRVWSDHLFRLNYDKLDIREIGLKVTAGNEN